MDRDWLGRMGWGLAALAMLTAGCGDGPGPWPDRPDGGGGPEPEPPRTLELETASSVTLELRESHTFEVRYLRADDSELVGHTITFALEGEAHDASLDAFEATTMADGRASGTLTAGSTPAAFRIRASAAHASDVHIDVSVSDEGFGDLAVTVVDEMEGRDVDRFVVRLHPESECDDAGLEDDLPARQVPVPEEMTAQLADLPADLTYAVVVHAEGSEGGVLGQGCADTHIEADAEVGVEVAVANVPLEVEGAYEGRLHVDAEASADAAVDALESAGFALLAEVGGDANLLLDGVQAYLDAHPDLDGETFALMRDEWEQDLADDLAAEGVGAEGTVEGMMDALHPMLLTVEVAGPLSLDPDSEEEPVRWPVDVARVEDPDSDEVHEVPLAGQLADVALEIHLDRDAFDVSALEVPVSLETLSVGALEALVAGDTDETLTETLYTPLGCGVLMDWAVEGHPLLVGMCDAQCVEAACAEAALQLISALVDGADGLDGTQSWMVFDTPAVDGALSDTVGDGRVDTLTLEGLSGSWTTDGGGGGAALTADLEAVRTEDPASP